MNQINLFIELTRLKKPIGFMLLFWPCAWGLTLAYDFSNNLNKYQIVSVECEGGLNDSGYSIPIKQKVYLKELGKEGTLGIICQNKE